MPKSDALPTILPQVGSSNFRGLTLYELYARQERNDRNIVMLENWLNEYWAISTYYVWIDCNELRKKLKQAIRLKRLKLWLLSLVGR